MLLTILICHISAVLAINQDLLGISLGPTYITAARFTAEEAPIPIGRVIGNEEYQAYFADTLAEEGKRIKKFGQWYIRDGKSLIPAPSDTHDPEQAHSIFTTALHSIREEALNALQHPVEIATISRPRHFNDSSKGAVIKAAMQIEPTMKQPWQVIDSVSAARLAYALDSCAGLGLKENACDMEEELHLIVLVEYNRKYLELTVAEVTENTCGIDGQIRLHALGAAALDHIPTTETHYQRVRDAFRAFMEDTHLTPDHYHEWSAIRAVVISGDAPDSAFGDLLRWIPAILGEHKDKIRNSIAPQYVGAVGAAHRGRHQILTPGFLDEITSRNLVPHDEL